MPDDHQAIARVRSAFEDFNVSTGDLDAYFARHYLPNGVVEFVDGFPVSGRYEGVEGYRRWYSESYGPYVDVRRRLDSITVEGGLVVALMTITGRSKDDDVELEVRLGNTYELDDGGRIRHLRIYVSHERALDAARGALAD
jgi:hypothetical protein